MAAPDIILYRPYALIKQDGSQLGIVTTGNSSLVFGIVINIYQTSDNYAVNDYVMFVKTGATEIFYDNDTYLMVDEAKILLKEQPPL